MNCYKKYYKNPRRCSKCSGEEFSASSWIISYRVGGRKKEEVVPGKNKTQARQLLAKRIGEMTNGEHGLIREKHILLQDYIEEFYWDLYGRKLKSARNYRYNLDAHIIPEFGNKLLNRVSMADVISWRNSLEEEGLKPSSINRLVDLLSNIYTKANKWQDTKHHPVKGIERLTENNERGDNYFLTPDQYKRLIRLTDNEILKKAITLSIATTLRKNNLFSLRWDKHINMKRRTITIPGTETKNREPVVLPIRSVVWNVLSSLPRRLDSQYVFISSRGGKFKAFMKSHWKVLRDKMAEVDPRFPADFHWHDLRATGASWLIQAGVPEQTVMRIMNLKSTRVLNRYSHMSQEHIQRELDKIEEYLE